MKIDFEKLVSRSLGTVLSRELKLSGIKMDLNRFLQIAIIGGLGIFAAMPFALVLIMKLNAGLAALAAFIAAAAYEIIIYAILEFRIEQRKNFVETVLPDYLQLTAANVRSGVALDKSMLLAARPDFGYFSDDVKEMNKDLYAGATLQSALINLSRTYRSVQLQHTVRLMIEGIQYGGGMTDLLNQLSKDMRNQAMVGKEISGQLFMYTIFIAFATIIGTPVLYALTSQMITMTNSVWAGILRQNPGGLPTQGISFLKPSPPQITTSEYYDFSIAAVLLISGFGSFIVSAISTGSVLKGLRYLPAFLVRGIVVFFVVSVVIGGIFTSDSGA